MLDPSTVADNLSDIFPHMISPTPVNFKRPIAVIIVVSIGAASKLPFHKSIAASMAVSMKFPADVNTAVQSIPARNCPMFCPI